MRPSRHFLAFSAAFALAICSATAKTSIGPGNVMGSWPLVTDVLASSSSSNACAKKIEHVEFSQLVKIDDVTLYSVDFDQIKVDGRECDDPNPVTDRLLLMPGKGALSNLTGIPEINTFDLEEAFGDSAFVGNDVKDFVNNQLRTQSFMLGVDLDKRTCGKFETPSNTPYLFFPLEKDMTLVESENVVLKGGQDHMVSLNSEALCVYSRTRPSTTADPVEDTLDKIQECFPAHATVELESGASRRMDELLVGDRVRVSSGEFSQVFAFTHKLANTESTFVKLTTASGHKISATPGHYLYVNDALAAARTVKPGDALRLASGLPSIVTAVTREIASGLYNPHTVQGDIVVNGVVASTYTTAVEPSVAHASMSLLGAAYRWLGLSLSFLESGVKPVAECLPRGAAMQ